MRMDVATVSPSAPYKDLVRLVVGQRAGGVFVLRGDGELAGVVSEADLLAKEEPQRYPDGRSRPRLRGRRRGKAAANVAADVMSAPVTIRPDAPVAEAARLMDRRHAWCLPVVDEGDKLLGMVTPRDLLRIFLRPDSKIRADVVDEVFKRYLGTNPALLHVRVNDGVVTVTGEVERKTMLPAVLPAIRAIDGVVDAEGELTYAVDDTHRPLTDELTDFGPRDF